MQIARRLVAALVVLVLAAPVAAQFPAKPVTVELMGPTSAVKGLSFAPGPDGSVPTMAVENIRGTLTLKYPNGKTGVVQVNGQVGASQDGGVVTRVWVWPAYELPSVPVATARLKDALAKLKIPPPAEKAEEITGWGKLPAAEVAKVLQAGTEYVVDGIEVRATIAQDAHHKTNKPIYTPRIELKMTQAAMKELNKPKGAKVLSHAGGVPVAAVAYSPDGKTLASAGGKTLVLWDVNTGEARSRIELDGSVIGVRFSPNGERLGLTFERGLVQVRNVADNKLVYEIDLEEGFPVFSRDLSRVATVKGGKVVARDVAMGREHVTIDRGQRESQAFAFSPDNKTIVVFDKFAAQAETYELASGNKIQTFTMKGPYASGHFSEAAYSPDGKTIVAGGLGKVVLWEAQRGGEEKAIIQSGPSKGISFSTDGARLSAGTWRAGGTENVYVLDAATLKEIVVLGPVSEVIRSTALSPDGKSVAAGVKGDVVIWPISR